LARFIVLVSASELLDEQDDREISNLQECSIFLRLQLIQLMELSLPLSQQLGYRVEELKKVGEDPLKFGMVPMFSCFKMHSVTTFHQDVPRSRFFRFWYPLVLFLVLIVGYDSFSHEFQVWCKLDVSARSNQDFYFAFWPSIWRW
jgi:hypothetical protein